MRLVDADALLAELHQYDDDCAFKDEFEYGLQQRLDTCIYAVEDAPTVDAVPVRHGHWVRWYEEVHDSFGVAYIPHCKCSECGMEFDPYIANRMNYCFNCGMKSDRKDGNNHG